MKLLKRSLVLLGCALAAAAAFTACELSLGGDDRYNPDAITGIEAVASAAAKSFQVGDTFSTDGVTVNAVKASGEKVDVTDKAKFSLSGKTFTSADIGDTSCTVTYDSFETSYDISIIGIVTAIKVTGIKASYVYNPGALETALEKAPDTAFEYEIEATYEGGGTGKLDAGLCKITYAADNVTVSYNSITTTYSKDNVKSAISKYVVESEAQYGDTKFEDGFNDPSPDIVIPNGKTMVATFKNYGNGTNDWANFVVEFYVPDGSGITGTAASNWWNYPALGGVAGVDFDVAEGTKSDNTVIPADLLNEKEITVIVGHTGTEFNISCTSPDEPGYKQTYSVPLKTDGAKNEIVFHFQTDHSYLVFN